MKAKASSKGARSDERKARGHSKGKHPPPGSGDAMKDAVGKRPGTRPTRKSARVVTVAVWQEWRDPVAMNQRILEYFREYSRRCGLSRAEQARRAGMDRRRYNKILYHAKVCTVDILCCLSNGMHMDPAYLLQLVEGTLRRQPTSLGSMKSAKKCRP